MLKKNVNGIKRMQIVSVKRLLICPFRKCRYEVMFMFWCKARRNFSQTRMQCDENVIVVTLYQFKCFYFIQGTCKVATGFNG